MQVRLEVDDLIIDNLKRRMKLNSAAEVIRESIAISDWATEEIQLGRVIVSVEEDGSNPSKLVSPGLRAARISVK